MDYQHRETARTVDEIMNDIVEENEKMVPDPKRIKELFEEKRLAKVLQQTYELQTRRPSKMYD